MSEPKKINVELIQRRPEGRDEDHITYQILDKYVGAHHPHLVDARIALAWRYGWKDDQDGRLKLGQARKASDLDRELHGYDFVILLNSEAWNAASFTREQMEALIDHELMHCAVTIDGETGEEKRDVGGRPVWRVRGHDVEEFHDIISRHGFWTSNLEHMAKVSLERAKLAGTLFGTAESLQKAVHVAEGLQAINQMNPELAGRIVDAVAGGTPEGDGIKAALAEISDAAIAARIDEAVQAAIDLGHVTVERLRRKLGCPIKVAENLCAAMLAGQLLFREGNEYTVNITAEQWEKLRPTLVVEGKAA